MRPVTAAFLRTLRGSHTMAARARVCTTFQTGTDPTGTEIPIVTGTVGVDGTAKIRSTLDLTTDGTRMWPNRADDLLAPYGNEVFVERGLQYANGTTEWCSLGYFRIQGPSQPAPPDGPIKLAAQDRMAGIIDARLLNPVQFQANVTYGQVLSQLILQVYPAATIEWDDATSATAIGRQVIVTSDRFKFLDDMVTALSKVWYWDHRGVLVIKAVPNPGQPVFTVDAGRNGVLVSAARELTRTNVYNAVVASGEAADTNAPVQGVAYDNNVNSPTYFYGRFGPIPQFYSSPFILTAAQARSAASAVLQQQLGLPYTVNFSAIPNPALEPDDPVQVVFSDRDAPETHVLKSLVIPLQAKDALQALTRDQTVILIGHS